MGRNTIKARKHESGRSITTKTAYGSTTDMIVTDEEVLSKINLNDGDVLVKDDVGYYITKKKRIDNGLADPIRYSEDLRSAMNLEIMEKLNAK